MKAITKRLRSLRASAGLIQLQVAKKAAMTVRHYHEIERGYRKATNDEIATIARVLNVTPADILTPDQPVQPTV